MATNGLELISKYQNEFLAKSDVQICAEILDIILCYKNPHIVLYGSNSMLQRYYLRLLISILRDQSDVEVFVCSGRRHVELSGYFSNLFKGIDLETASQSERDKLRVLVFMDGSKIKKEDDELICEIQKGFPGLGLAYVTIAASEIVNDLRSKSFILKKEAQQERIQSLVNNTLTAARRRRLVKILTR